MGDPRVNSLIIITHRDKGMKQRAVELHRTKGERELPWVVESRVMNFGGKAGQFKVIWKEDKEIHT